ncbi:LacI family transcriptional regulator [Opitutaceae bacterium TAV5]|nr:LacI family transcriptional regulator [Opitutaceae bacterium TAV5]
MSQQHMRVSLRQVAARAGVSHVAVSMALRGRPNIPEKTRVRIRAIAEEMGYRADPMLSALNMYRQTRRGAAYQAGLAWINAFPEKNTLRNNPDFDLYWRGAVATAREAGFSLDEFWMYEPGMTPQRLAKILHSRQVQGLLLPPMPAAHVLLELPWDAVSTVAIGYSHEPVFHIVVNAHYRSARDAMRRLHRLGYRRVGFVTWPALEQRTDCNFRSGFVCECEQLGLSPLICSVPEGPMWKRNDAVDTYRKSAAQIRRWMREHRPDAMLLPDPYCARVLGFEPAASAAGAKPASSRNRKPVIAVLATYPQDPWFAGIDQDAERIGAAAVNHLISMIQRNERGRPERPLRILVEGAWRDGASVPGR